MIQAEQCFFDCVNAPVRHVRARVELYEGSTLLHTFKHTDRLKSLTIERVGENKFFGYGICQKVNMHLIDENAELDMTTANVLDVAFGTGCDFIYPFPYFQVSEVRRDENTNELSITAYDALYKANNHNVSELNLPGGYTIETFTIACAALLGLPLNIQGSGFNTEYPDGANFEGTETIREALNAVAEATQTIYFINHNYELTFLSLDREGAEVWEINKDRYFTLDSSTNRRLANITSTNELGDSVFVALAESGTTQYIRNNPFYDLREDIDELLEIALANVGGLTINQFECEWRGNYLLEIGDKISLTTKEGEKVFAYVLNDVMTYDGTFSAQTQWSYEDNEGETDSNPATLGDALKQTYAKVDKANKEIAIVASATEENKSNIAALQLNTESIAASVSKVEENTLLSLDGINEELGTLTNKVEAAMTAEGVKLSIQEELANGVSKVYTETGFAFDADGLRVSKTGSEMETLLDEDGLSVFRDNTEVLTADNTGVNGINMTVRQYLIVGGSRFEAYGAGRTGCFWIGG